MKFPICLRPSSRSAAAVAALLSAPLSLLAQAPVRRLSTLPTSIESRVDVAPVSGRVRAAADLGHLDGNTQLSGMSLVLKPGAEQQAALDKLTVEQQTPGSANFHKWLTPEQFGERFGTAAEDITVLQNWLQNRGLTVNSVSPSRNRVVFSGTAASVESAFGLNMERLRISGQDFFENNTDVTLPASLSAVVSGVSGLSSFHITPPVHTAQAVSALPEYSNGSCSSGTGTCAHYLVPWDWRQIFSVNTLVNQGFNGAGIAIGVIGQSTVDTQQLTYFQAKTGQTANLPAMVLVPNTGNAGQLSAGDQGESELDLEYASGVAPGASIKFIYTGLSRNNGVFDAMAYAITNNLAPILTLSYGGCEAADASYAVKVFEPILQQSNTQGQTILVSSGDTGAASCEGSSTAKTTTGGISVSYPASSPYVTGVGGTQLTGTTSTYWATTNNSFAGSAIGYIPEIAWNDSATYSSIAQSGGGYSNIFTKPTWQTGTGVPADGKRDVPDISFPSSVAVNGYIVCTVGSAPCSNSTVGFASGGGSLVGGTSAAAPSLAGMLAVIQQANGGTALGNINPSLYSLAAGASASTVFHDITSGNNIVACTGGTTGCSSTNATVAGTLGFTATAGYDQVTGLGSADAVGLRNALKALSTKLSSTTTVTAATNSPAGGSTDLITVKVTGAGTTPTGTVTISVDGITATSPTLNAGSTTYSYAVPACTTVAACNHTVTAAYAGDTAYTASTGSVTLTVPGTSSGKLAPTVAISAATTTPVSNSSDLLTVTVGGSGASPTGTVVLSIDGTTAATLTLTGTATATYTYTVPSCTTTTACTHTVSASYSGDTAYSTGTASLTLTTPGVVITPAISLTPGSTSVTVTASGTATNNINVTSTGGFAGTVNFTAGITSSNSASFSGCYTLASSTVASNGTATSLMTIFTNTANCAKPGAVRIGAPLVSGNGTPATPLSRTGLVLMSASLLAVFGFRRRLRPGALLLLVASLAVFGLAGCGSGGTAATTTTVSTTQAGSYVIQVNGTGVPTSGSSVTASTTFTLVVQ